jgi:hypothetical protein
MEFYILKTLMGHKNNKFRKKIVFLGQRKICPPPFKNPCYSPIGQNWKSVRRCHSQKIPKIQKNPSTSQHQRIIGKLTISIFL